MNSSKRQRDTERIKYSERVILFSFVLLPLFTPSTSAAPTRNFLSSNPTPLSRLSCIDDKKPSLKCRQGWGLPCSSINPSFLQLRCGHAYDHEWEGGRDDNDDDNDGEDDYSSEDQDEMDEASEDEATAQHRQRRDLRRNPNAPNPYDKRGSSNNKNTINSKRLHPRHGQPGRTPAPYIPRNKKKKKKSAIVKLAKSSLSLSKKAATTTLSTSGKAAFYLMRPKSIKPQEIVGVWRLDQQVGLQQSVANIELTPRGLVVIKAGIDNKIIWKSPSQFVKASWPKACRIEFEAPAFQPSPKVKPRLLFYKGYLERKVADSSVIKMSGTLYRIEHPKSMFGKDLPVRYHKIGSFVARRRVVVVQDDDDDEYDDDEEDMYDDDLHANEKVSKEARHDGDEEYDDEEYEEYDEE